MLLFLPLAFAGLPNIDFGFPGIDITLFGETFKWNIIGYDAAHGGLPYFCAYMIAIDVYKRQGFDHDTRYLKVCSYKREASAVGVAKHYLQAFIKTCLLYTSSMHQMCRLYNKVLHSIVYSSLQCLIHIVDLLAITGLYVIDDDLCLSLIHIYPTFTVAPTSTNRNTSAATHSFPYFTEILFATTSLFFCKPIPMNTVSYTHLVELAKKADCS